MIVRTTSRAVFECRDRSCAPPPVGTGGSRPSGGGGGRGTQRTAEMEKIARHQLKRNGMTDAETDEVLGGGGTNGLKGIARNILSRNGFTKGEVSALVGRDKGDSGSASASAPKTHPWQRPFEAGNWERVTDKSDIILHSMTMKLTEGIIKNEIFRKFMEDEFAEQADQDIKDGVHIYMNGTISIVITPDRTTGEIDEAALNRTQKMVELLMQKFKPPVTSVQISLTREVINGDPSALGMTRLTSDSDVFSSIVLSETVIGSERLVSSMRNPMSWQTSDKSINTGDFVIAHEWGHVMDRRLVVPEPKELFDTWVRKPYGVGLSQYGRSSPAEAYAESFADWVTSGGKTVNPATLAYRDHYGWEVP